MRVIAPEIPLTRIAAITPAHREHLRQMKADFDQAYAEIEDVNDRTSPSFRNAEALYRAWIKVIDAQALALLDDLDAFDIGGGGPRPEPQPSPRAYYSPVVPMRAARWITSSPKWMRSFTLATSSTTTTRSRLRPRRPIDGPTFADPLYPKSNSLELVLTTVMIRRSKHPALTKQSSFGLAAGELTGKLRALQAHCIASRAAALRCSCDRTRIETIELCAITSRACGGHSSSNQDELLRLSVAPIDGACRSPTAPRHELARRSGRRLTVVRT